MSTRPIAPGITFYDFENRRGYMVRLRRDGVQYNQYFSFTRCGGQRKALKMAKDHYNALLEELGPATSPTKGLVTNRNSTGKVGVHVAYSLDSRYPNCEYWSYCASWKTEAGERKKISFAYNKYGEDAAWELACLARDHEIADRAQVEALYEKEQKKAERRKKTATKKKSAGAKKKAAAR